MQNAQPPFPPSLEERYKQPRFISAGGAGAVYAALDKNLNKRVAIKLLNVNSGDQKLLRFQQEAKTIAKLNHANIVTALDFGLVDERIAYLVLDLVGDGSLNSLIQKRETLSVKKCLDIFRQICAGMSYAHTQGVLHRDLKPSNVLLEKSSSEHPVAKVADFGIAKISGTLIFATTGNIYIGTPAFTSPEQFCGDDVDERSDIYSFGCLMFATLKGIAPFVGDTTTDLALKHANDRVPPINRTYSGEDVPPVLQEIVETCLEKHPEDRYADFAEVEDLIVQLQKESLEFEDQWQRKGKDTEPYSVSSSNPYSGNTESVPFVLGVNSPSRQVIATVAVLVLILVGVICTRLGFDHNFLFNQSGTTAGDVKKSTIFSVPHLLTKNATNHDFVADQPKLSETELAKPIPNLLGIAQTKMDNHNYSMANSYLDGVLDKEPNNSKALKMRSDSRRALKFYKGAIDDISKAIQIEPDNEKLTLRRAQLSKEIGDLNGALKDFTTYLKADPTSAKIFREHARLCEELGKDTEALASYSKSIELDPEDPSSFRGRGRLFQTTGQLHEALKDLNNAIALKPNHSGDFGARGRVYMDLHQYQKAVDDYSRAIELDQTRTIYYSMRAEAYALLGEKDLAARDRSLSKLD